MGSALTGDRYAELVGFGFLADDLADRMQGTDFVFSLGGGVDLGVDAAGGWSVEAHRFRLGRWEIDLVVRMGQTVAFVEVKTRQSEAFGSPLEAVQAHKADRLGRVAAIWSLRFGRPGDEYRFDVVGVTLRRGQQPLVEHVPDAWRLGEWRGRR